MSCLFNSMSYFFCQDSNTIRQKICNYLERGGTIIEGLDTKLILSFEQPNYIERMKNTNTWGGAIEIQAACTIWNTKIIVYNIRDTKRSKIIFAPYNNINCVNCIHIAWSGGHYKPIKL